VRKITGPQQPAKVSGSRCILCVALTALLLAVGACGDGQDEPAAHQAAAACPLLVDTSALRAFWDLADQSPGSLEAMIAEADGPVWRFWRRSFIHDVVRAESIGRAMFIALEGREQLPDRIRDRTVRLDLVRNFELSRDRRAEITAAVARFVEEEHGCEVFVLLQGWLPEAALPDTLRLTIMPGLPEIRFFEDIFLVDAGLVWASGPAQLVQFLASSLYKQRTLVEGPHPINTQGKDTFLHALRLVRNEAVPAYLDDMPEIAFDPRHTIIGRAAPRPDELCLQAIRTLRGVDAGLSHVLALAEPTDEHWQNLYRIFVGAQSWQATGWYMARTIADQLGRARLQEVGGSVPDFFAAYQEACGRLPASSSAPRGSLAYFLADAPAFSEANAAWLDRELRRLFP
jgi:hypothetical protein